jgi:hypothetical protein
VATWKRFAAPGIGADTLGSAGLVAKTSAGRAVQDFRILIANQTCKSDLAGLKNLEPSEKEIDHDASCFFAACIGSSIWDIDTGFSKNVELYCSSIPDPIWNFRTGELRQNEKPGGFFQEFLPFNNFRKM